MQKKTSAPANHALNPFIEKHQKDVMGILYSFDRRRLQGSLRYLYCREIFEGYLSKARVLYKDFKQFATGLTDEVCLHAEQLAQSLERPFTYLASSALSKEEAAQNIVRRDHIKEGLVAVFNRVEPCRTYKMRGNYQTKMLEPRLELGKCLHLYFYVQHPRLGLVHLRLQTWFPFLMHLCLNGHEWLARQMDGPTVRFHAVVCDKLAVQKEEEARRAADPKYLYKPDHLYDRLTRSLFAKFHQVADRYHLCIAKRGNKNRNAALLQLPAPLPS
jgi:hypothetical protein